VGLLALACYYWGVRSGYKTAQLDHILRQENVENFIDSAGDSQPGDVTHLD
jgi:hypothetical protein